MTHDPLGRGSDGGGSSPFSPTGHLKPNRRGVTSTMPRVRIDPDAATRGRPICVRQRRYTKVGENANKDQGAEEFGGSPNGRGGPSRSDL